MKSILIGLGVVLATAGAANAACSQAGLAGSWRIQSEDLFCKTVTISSTGVVAGTTANCRFRGSAATVTGTLKATGCKITGTARVAGQPFSVVGRVDAAMGLMISIPDALNGFVAIRN